MPPETREPGDYQLTQERFDQLPYDVKLWIDQLRRQVSALQQELETSKENFRTIIEDDMKMPMSEHVRTWGEALRYYAQDKFGGEAETARAALASPPEETEKRSSPKIGPDTGQSATCNDPRHAMLERLVEALRTWHSSKDCGSEHCVTNKLLKEYDQLTRGE